MTCTPLSIRKSILQPHLLFVNPYWGKTGARTQKMALKPDRKIRLAFQRDYIERNGE
jgi:hypothetical protein